MKLELFEEIQTTFARFVRKFCEIPKQGNAVSLAYQNYHFHSFKAMTQTLTDALLHVNYAQFNTIEDNIVYNTSFAIVLDKHVNIIRHIAFDKIDEQTQQDILQVIKLEIDNLSLEQSTNEHYLPIVMNCLNRTNKLCSIYGTIYVDQANQHYILNLNYLKVQTQDEDSSLEFNYYLKDKAKTKDIYTQIKNEPNIDLKKILNILQTQNTTLEEFESNINYFYGDCLDSYSEKERILRSLELVLFSDNTMDQIASVCGYNSPVTLLRVYHQSNRLNNNAIIRYAN